MYSALVRYPPVLPVVLRLLLLVLCVVQRVVVTVVVPPVAVLVVMLLVGNWGKRRPPLCWVGVVDLMAVPQKI